MYEARTRELNFLKGLLEVSKAVNSALDVKKVLHLLVKTATTALDIKAAAVRLLDEKRQQMELVASYGSERPLYHQGSGEHRPLHLRGHAGQGRVHL
jgi:signal transduction protein with GAF and PtsI domain